MRPLLRLLSHRTRSWTRRVLFALACLQVVSPAMAAVADSWRLDRRTPFAHIEEKGSAACVVVHHDDCALCAIATGSCARPAAPSALPLVAVADVSRLSAVVTRPQRLRGFAPTSRAPPAVLG